MKYPELDIGTAQKPACTGRDPRGTPGAVPPKPVHLSRIASLLIERGFIDQESLLAAQQRQRGAQRPLGEILIEQGALTELDFLRLLGEVSHLPMLDAEDLKPDPDVQKLVPMEVAQRLGILPLRIDEGALIVATSDPFQLPDFDELAARTDLHVRPMLAAPSAVREALRKARGGEESLHDLLKHMPDPEDGVVKIEESDPSAHDEGAPKEEDDGHAVVLDDEEENAPIVRLLNLILTDAIRQGASDIHIEPEKDRVRVRFRLDGDLAEALELAANVRDRLILRLKIVSRLIITEKRRPQDGRAKVTLGGKQYDLRVSTIPSYFGEKAVIRILDANAEIFDLAQSGIEPAELEMWRELIHQPRGLVLVTGPTGSGKSTTLLASLLELRSSTKNIVTVEDPVEYQFPGIVHVPVRTNIGMTFAAALRSVLRQDPDIVLVGEIRDQETAEIALRAAMTGHLVLSTLHTNDAVSTLGRLSDLGLSRRLLSTTLLGILAQRLIATNCSECAEPAVFPQEELRRLGGTLPSDVNAHTQQGSGCHTCGGSGSRGRTAIVELLRVTPALEGLIASNAPPPDILAQAQRDGTRTLLESGVDKVLSGRATPEQVLRVASARMGAIDGSEAPAESACTGEAPAPDAPPAEPTPVPEMRVEDSTTAPLAADGPSATEGCSRCGACLGAEATTCEVCGTPLVRDQRKTVAIICDDSPVVRRLVRAALEPLFDSIAEADNGAVCLDMVARANPDLLVVDHEMPGLTGKEVIQELRSRLATATLPIMMLSAVEDVELEDQILQAGADDYLRKPITMKRLRVRTQALLKAAGRRTILSLETEIPAI